MRAFALFVASLAIAPRAGAQVADVPLELSWEAPAECPSLLDVRARVRRSLGARDDRKLPRLRVDARVVRAGSYYRGDVALIREERAARREFQSESCDALTGAITLSIALAFGDGEAQSNDASPAPPPPQNPRPTSAEAEPPPARPAPRSTEPDGAAARGSFALGGGAAWSPEGLGGTVLGLQALASLRTRRASLEWIGRAWLPHTVHLNDAGIARFWAATTSLGPSLRASFSSFEIQLGVAFQAGLIHGAGATIRSPREAVAPWYAVAPNVTVSMKLGRVRVALSQELAVGLVQPRFAIEPYGEVYRAGRVVLSTTLSLPWDAASF